MIIFQVNFNIIFAKTKINVDNGGGYQIDNKREIPECFSTKVLLKECTNSPAYNYIITGKVQANNGGLAVWRVDE